MLTDPISDYLTRVRNALQAEHLDVEVPASRLKKEVTRILKEQGYISDYAVEPTAVGEVIKIQLRYTDDRRPVITGIERISRGDIAGAIRRLCSHASRLSRGSSVFQGRAAAATRTRRRSRA